MLPLQDILLTDSKLAPLSQRVEQMTELLNRLKTALPAPLNTHITAVNYHNKTLLIYCDGPAWATRLRFQSQLLLKTGKTLLGLTDLNNVRIKVSLPTQRAATDQKRKLCLSRQTAATLQGMSETSTDPLLQASLAKLARR